MQRNQNQEDWHKKCSDVIENLIQNKLKELIITPRTAAQAPPVGTPSSLTKSNPTRTTFEDFVDALKQNRSLEIFQLDEAPKIAEWNTYNAAILGEALKDHPALKRINVSLESCQDLEIITAFLQCLTGTAQIEYLGISIHSETDEFLNNLGNLLLNKTCLQEFYIQTSIKLDPSLEKEKNLQSFCDGLGAQKNLRVLLLGSISLQDAGIQQLSFSMQNVTSLRELLLIECDIQDEAKSISHIVHRNPSLYKVYLNYNPLEADGIETVLPAIFSLKELKSLNLSYTEFDYMTFCEKLTRQQFRRLDFNSEINPFFDLITQLVLRNTALVELYLCGLGINYKKIQELQPILSNPSLCRLQKLRCYDSTTLPYNTMHANLLVAILQNNRHLCELGSAESKMNNIAYYIAADINERLFYLEQWDRFIEAVWWLFAAYYQNPPDSQVTPLSLFSGRRNNPISAQLIKTLLTFIGPNTPNTNNGVKPCIDLIEDNLKKRSLAEKKSESESQKKPAAWWWSTTYISENHQPRLLFVPRKVTTPNLMQLSELIRLMDFYLPYAKSIQDKNESDVIQFDLSQNSMEGRLYLKNLFSRFISSYKQCTPGFNYSQDVADAIVNLSEDGKLTIHGTSITNLKILMHSFSPTQETKNKCSVM